MDYELLPETIVNMTNLLNLTIKDNRISSLPSNLGNLTNLQILDLAGNFLTTLPEILEAWAISGC